MYHLAYFWTQVDHTVDVAHQAPYDPFGNTAQSMAPSNHANQAGNVNPYAPDSNGYGGSGFYQGQNNYTQPVGADLLVVIRTNTLQSCNTICMRPGDLFGKIYSRTSD